MDALPDWDAHLDNEPLVCSEVEPTYELIQVARERTTTVKNAFDMHKLLLKGKNRRGRMIRILFARDTLPHLCDADILYALAIADHHRWKTLILQTDDVYGDYIEAVNPAMRDTNYDRGMGGFVVACIDR